MAGSSPPPGPACAEPGKWDFSPLGWAALLLLAAWGRAPMRWWARRWHSQVACPAPRSQGHFGALTLGAVIVASALILRPVIRAGRS